MGESFKNSLFKLNLEGENDVLVLPRILQVHAIISEPTQVNFLEYDSKKGAKLDLPLFFSKKELSPGLKQGDFIHCDIRKVKCKVIGENIPKTLEVNVEGKEIGDRVFKKEITLPNNATLSESTLKVIATIKDK